MSEDYLDKGDGEEGEVHLLIVHDLDKDRPPEGGLVCGVLITKCVL